ncbi:MAG: UDP-N-acetylglucosamine--N-acetylmuramyl-(pentapeptide) pyrophosphoryl-undecaprenol N-acetylglucosamine transferase [Verrucomicrobiota bacterium JB022]|nr:UDP-N-acetylglucosamine--N-acetylmuramyl-(pentapeptide) pyrophosphoryl-undecaprenol N-acetylglucosamine transferase [Verrucomicrobiota bacterium JB022]
MAKAYIVCGGTGGHLAPGIALAQRWRARGHSCRLVVSNKDVDSRLAKHYPDFDFLRAPGRPFSWNPLRLTRCLWAYTRAFVIAATLLKRDRPDVVISFGGFLGLPWALMAKMWEIPLVLHEANRVPGKATRMLSAFACRVYLPAGVRHPRVPNHLVRPLGLPLREEVQHIKKAEVRERWGIPIGVKLVVVLGGSQGATSLNDWVEEHRHTLINEGIWVICVTGPNKGEARTADYDSPEGFKVRFQWIPFTDKMAELLSVADIAITRAGAGTLAELVRCLTPSILIPYPHAADNHQAANAKYLEQRGGGIVVPQNKLDTLLTEALDLVFNDWLLGRMRENLRLLASDDAGLTMVQDIEFILSARQVEQATASTGSAT